MQSCSCQTSDLKPTRTAFKTRVCPISVTREVLCLLRFHHPRVQAHRSRHMAGPHHVVDVCTAYLGEVVTGDKNSVGCYISRTGLVRKTHLTRVTSSWTYQ